MTKKNYVVLFLVAVAFSASVEAQEQIDNIMISGCSELDYIFPDGSIIDNPNSVRLVNWSYIPELRNGMLDVLFNYGPIEGAQFFFQECRTVTLRGGVIRESDRVSYRVKYRNSTEMTTINRNIYGSIGFDNSSEVLNILIQLAERGNLFADIKLLGLKF